MLPQDAVDGKLQSLDERVLGEEAERKLKWSGDAANMANRRATKADPPPPPPPPHDLMGVPENEEAPTEHLFSCAGSGEIIDRKSNIKHCERVRSHQHQFHQHEEKEEWWLPMVGREKVLISARAKENIYKIVYQKTSHFNYARRIVLEMIPAHRREEGQ